MVFERQGCQRSTTRACESVPYFDLFREPFAELSAEQIGDDEALDHIATLEGGLRSNVQKLEKILKRYATNDAPANIRERIHIIKTKALYPFKKETVQGLRRVVSDLQETGAWHCCAPTVCRPEHLSFAERKH